MVVHAYGKVNLYLDVLDRRPDGYTNIETLFQTVGIHDTLTFESRPRDLSLSCSDPALATDESNLIHRAAKLVQAVSGCEKGVHVHLDKRIPVAGGMAGGSVDAAAALRGLNTLWELGLTEDVLAGCALELGSDVPYCLTGGTAAATGRGEIIQTLPALPETWFVLVRPPLGISARAVYNHPALTRNAETPIDGKTRAFREALERLQAGRVADLLFNRMEGAIFAMHPELAALRDRLMDAGCAAAIISGSGPTLVGLCADETDAQRIEAELEPLAALRVPAVRSSIVFETA